MGKKSLQRALKSKVRKKLRSMAVIPFVLGSMLLPGYTPALAMQEHIRHSREQLYHNNNLLLSNRYNTTNDIYNSYNSSPALRYVERVQPRITSSDTIGNSDPTRDDAEVRVVTGHGKIGNDDRGKKMDQQSYGGFSGLAPEFHTGSLNNWGQHHWIHKNHYYYVNEGGKINVNIYGSDFHQHFGSVALRKDDVFFRVSVNLRARIELYTGNLIFSNANISWNGGFKIAIRGVADPSGRVTEGISIISTNSTIHGAIQGTTQADTLSLNGGSVIASKYFSGFDYISLGKGNDQVTIGGTTFTTVQDLYMGEGNDIVLLNSSQSGYSGAGIYAGSGNDSINITGTVASTISGGIYAGAGDDTLKYQAQNLKLSNVYMGSGNDVIEINQAPSAMTFDAGSGNNTIKIIGSVSLNNATFVTGTGNSIVELGSASYNKEIHFGRGNNTIRVTSGSYTYGGSLQVDSSSALYLEANKSGGNISINGVNNNGLFGLSIGNGASYSGPTNSGNGRVDIHFYNGSQLKSNLNSGAGNDTFTLDKISTTYGIDAGRGSNIITITSTTVGAVKADGNDTVTVKNSTLSGGVTLNNNGATRDITLENLQFSNGGSFMAHTTSRTNLSIKGALNAVNNNNFSFTAKGGTQNIQIEALTMSNRGVTLQFEPTSASTVKFMGTLSMGNVNITTARSNVTFDGVTTTNFGTLATSSHNDSILLQSGTNFSGTLNLGNSSSGSDTVELRDSTITRQGKIDYKGDLSFYGYGGSKLDGTLQASGKLNVHLEGTSNISGDIIHQTSKEISISLLNQSSIQGKISVDTNTPLNLKVEGRDSSLLRTDVISGKANDTIQVDIYDSMTYSGKINAGDGDNKLILTNRSANSNISEIRAGTGNDSAEIRGGLFNGGDKFQLGKGNNSVRISGEVTMAGNLNVYEVQETTTDILVNSSAKLTANIHTGVVQGKVAVNNNALVNGDIKGLAGLTVEVKSNSTVKGDITAGLGDANISLTSALVDGNVSSNRGQRVTGTINSSTISGGLTAVTNGANVTLKINSSNVGQQILLSNANVSGAGNTFQHKLVVQGSSTLVLSNSHIAQDVSLSNGDSTVNFSGDTIGNGFTVVDGAYGVTFNNSQLTGDMNIRQANLTLNSTGSTIDGSIIFNPAPGRTAENNISIERGTVKGSITFSNNTTPNLLKLSSSNVGKDISIGLGNNTVELTNSTVVGDIHFSGTTTTVITNSSVKGKLDFSSASLLDQNLTIIGGKWNGIELGRTNNTVTIRDVDLSDTSGISLKGNDSVDHVTLVNVQATGSIYLGSGNDLLRLVNTTIHGGIDMQAGLNTLVLNNANIKGDIVADYIEVEGNSYVFTDPITRAGTVVSIGLSDNSSETHLSNGSILSLTPTGVGDTVNIYGKMHVEGGSIGIDVDFVDGLHDTIIVKDGASVLGDSGFIIVTPVNVFTGTEILQDQISGVLYAEKEKSFQYLPRLRDVFVQAGGYLYQLQSDKTNPNSFNLVQSGEDPLNYGYGTMVLSGRNYSRNLLDSLEEQGIVSLISGSEERTSYGRKNRKDIMTGWIQTSVSSNQITAPFIPSVESSLVTVLTGLDIKELDIRKKDRLLFRFFGGYGQGTSKYKYDTWNIEGKMQAYSAGGQFMWENLRNNSYRFYLRSTTWADIFKNTLHNIVSFHPEEWTSTTVSTALAMGIKMKFNRFIVIPEVEFVYSYHSASEFISMTKNLVEIKEAHQFTTKIQGTAAYNFPFGLTPYVRVALEIPVGSMPKGSDGIYIAGKYHKYELSDILTRLGVGVNYAVSLGGLDLTAYLDASGHFGREEGFKASLGFALGF